MTEQSNLEWIRQQWAAWLKTEQALNYMKGAVPKYHCEHIAAMFTAFCMDVLRRERAS